jgi:copper resistance protein B
VTRAWLAGALALAAAGAAQAQPMGHAMHGMAPAPRADQSDAPQAPPPPPPTDFAADRTYDPAATQAARARLRREHGAVSYGRARADVAEARIRAGADGYRWKGEASLGGDVDRLVVKSEGEGTRGEGVEAAELQALYSHAVGPYFDLQAGLRQDVEPKGRTYVAVGTEGIMPYWVDVEAAAFLSTKGELLARAEGSYDLRLTQRLILQPRAELEFAAQDTRATRTGAGLSSAELGLRLRYEMRRQLAPYVGVVYERRFGRTADYVRMDGGDPDSVSLVAGIRAGF